MNEPEEDEREQANHPTGSELVNTAGDAARVIDSESIFAGRREVWIRHGDDMYRLRLTSSGKLYLSK